MPQEGLDKMVEALATLRPEADLRALPLRKALRRMGLWDTEGPMLLLRPAIVAGLVVLLFYPTVVQCLDFGLAQVRMEDLGDPAALPSVHLQVRGAVRQDLRLRVYGRRRSGGDAGTRAVYVPIVDPGWEPGRPVELLAEVDDLEAANALPSDLLTGTLRVRGLSSVFVPNLESLFQEAGVPLMTGYGILQVPGYAEASVWRRGLGLLPVLIVVLLSLLYAIGCYVDRHPPRPPETQAD
jgi:hypothetical protein